MLFQKRKKAVLEAQGKLKNAFEMLEQSLKPFSIVDRFVREHPYQASIAAVVITVLVSSENSGKMLAKHGGKLFMDVINKGLKR